MPITTSFSCKAFLRGKNVLSPCVCTLRSVSFAVWMFRALTRSRPHSIRKLALKCYQLRHESLRWIRSHISNPLYTYLFGYQRLCQPETWVHYLLLDYLCELLWNWHESRCCEISHVCVKCQAWPSRTWTKADGWCGWHCYWKLTLKFYQLIHESLNWIPPITWDITTFFSSTQVQYKLNRLSL